MPAPISEEVKQRALALMAQSNEQTINAKSIEVFNKLQQEGHPVSVRTLNRWASKTPISIGPANSRANRSRHVTNVDENINSINQCLNQHQGQISIREIAKIIVFGVFQNFVNIVVYVRGLWLGPA